MTEFNITLNLQHNAYPQRCCLRRGDRGRLLTIHIRDGLTAPDFTGASAALTARKPDGSLVYQDCTLEDGRLQTRLTSALTDQPGEVACEVRIFDEQANLLTTGRFLLEIHDTLYHDGDDVLPPAAPTRVLMAPEGCREGQYFRISQVDENGTAVKVEATDSPGGGYYTPQFAANDQGGLDLGYAKSEVWMEDLETVTIPLLQGEPGPQGEPGVPGAPGAAGPQGNPGIYYGSGDMPEGYFVQVDPNGSEVTAMEEIVAAVLAALPVYNGEVVT